MDIHIQEVPQTPNYNEPKEIHTKKHNQLVISQRHRENFENSKRKMTCHAQGNPDKINDFSPETLQVKRDRLMY